MKPESYIVSDVLHIFVYAVCIFQYQHDFFKNRINATWVIFKTLVIAICNNVECFWCTHLLQRRISVLRKRGAPQDL